MEKNFEKLRHLPAMEPIDYQAIVWYEDGNQPEIIHKVSGGHLIYFDGNEAAGVWTDEEIRSHFRLPPLCWLKDGNPVYVGDEIWYSLYNFAIRVTELDQFGGIRGVVSGYIGENPCCYRGGEITNAPIANWTFTAPTRKVTHSGFMKVFTKTPVTHPNKAKRYCSNVYATREEAEAIDVYPSSVVIEVKWEE